jgi:hypothetical protein
VESTAALAPSDVLPTLPELSDALLAASQPYVGRWNRLVSTTNWEKGRIILQWRESLAAQGLPVTEYSDEAWSRLVGGVTGQHAGRLRRVTQRFGQVHEQYPGLYWSHFQAALDWQDAEMWLEGAVRSGWSVAQMREQRWQTLGEVAAERPQAEDVVSGETDEDFEPARRQEPTPTSITGEYAEVTGPRHDGPDFGEEPFDSRSAAGVPWDVATEDRKAAPAVRPFANLPELPDDLADAFDNMKLAILHHKQDGWQSISSADVLRTLDALKALVAAPSDAAPF